MPTFNIINAKTEEHVATVYDIDYDKAIVVANNFGYNMKAVLESTIEPLNQNKNIKDIQLSLGTDSFHFNETFSDIAEFVDRVRKENVGLTDDQITMKFDEDYSDHEMVTLTVPKRI